MFVVHFCLLPFCCFAISCYIKFFVLRCVVLRCFSRVCVDACSLRFTMRACLRLLYVALMLRCDLPRFHFRYVFFSVRLRLFNYFTCVFVEYFVVVALLN